MNSNQTPPDQPKTESQKPRVNWRIAAIVLYVAASVALYFVLAPAMADQDRLASQLEAAGAWGVVSYILLYSAQMFIPWLPGAPLDIIGGATFGFWETNILSTLSASGSGLIIFLIVRRIGLEQIVARFPGLLESPWRLVKIIKAQPWSLIAVNMLTGDVAYFVAGSAKTPLVFTIVLLGVQRLPSVMVGTAFGAGLISNVLGQQLDVLVAVASIGTIIGLTIGFAIARKYLPGWLSRIEVDKVQDEDLV